MKRQQLLGLILGIIVLLSMTTIASAVEASPSDTTVNGYVTGCTGEYFNNMTLSGSPVLVRSDGSINFYWREYTSPGTGVNTSHYSVRWNCSAFVSTEGTYTLTMTTDDGMNLFVDGNLLMWAWYDQGPSTYSKSIYLSTGWHTVQVEYYNDTLGGTAQVSVALASAAASSITGVTGSCTGEYFNNIDLSGTPVLVRTDVGINFDWGPGVSPGTGVNSSYYSVRWTCNVTTTMSRGYTFTALTDDGMNIWVDGNYLISAWKDQSPTTYTNSIYAAAGAHVVRVEYYNRTMDGVAKISVY